MGIAAFNWTEEGNNQLTLVMNRDNWDSWETEPATTWDESNQILSVSPPHSFGTWFGMSRQGRVVFHVNPKNNLSPTLRPIDFLLRDMSLWDYAKEWSAKSDLALIMSAGLAYHMIVADINTKSMVYISKRSANESHVQTKEVGFGVHTLCPDGLDVQFPKYLHHLKTFSYEMLDKEVASMKELAQRFITYDPYEADKENPFDIFGKKKLLHEITSTTAMAVKRNKEVMFYERFWENGKWDDNDFTFNMDYLLQLMTIAQHPNIIIYNKSSC